MTFDVTGVVSTIESVAAAAVLIGGAAAAMRIGISAWRWLLVGVESRRISRDDLADHDEEMSRRG